MPLQTPRTRHRRIASLALLSYVGAAAAGPPTPSAAPDGSLEDLARTTAAAHLAALGPAERLEVAPIRGPAPPAECSGKIRATIAPGIQVQRRVLVELRCEGTGSWHLYVPVKVVGTTPVVLTAHAIVAGSLLARGDLAIEQRDAVGLPPGYLNDPAIAVGMTASRAIGGGVILTTQQLAGTKTVQRGQTVTLVANADGISVRMPGKALSDGFINQRVRVENLSSGKTVEGIARSEQVVEIVLQ